MRRQRCRKLREFDPPSPGADEVVSRVAYSGICRCELSGFMGQNSLRGAPHGFGHELSGWIDSGGERVPGASGLHELFAYSISNFRTVLDWLASGPIGLWQGVMVAPLAEGPTWYERLVRGDISSRSFSSGSVRRAGRLAAGTPHEDRIGGPVLSCNARDPRYRRRQPGHASGPGARWGYTAGASAKPRRR